VIFEPLKIFRDRILLSNPERKSDRTTVMHGGPEMVFLPAGTFLMGGERGDFDEKPITKVALDAFAIGRTPVTCSDYYLFCLDTGPKGPHYYQQGQDKPVVRVTWHNACRYCDWLAERTGFLYVLPTEAEWEYACRAGTTTRWRFGDDVARLGDFGWFDQNASHGARPVGQKQEFPWHLFDMHGNIWEWCSDWYAYDTYQRGSGPENGHSLREILSKGVEKNFGLKNLLFVYFQGRLAKFIHSHRIPMRVLM
jgi:formylglycine-generating enzyme required for sulfatase activity